MQWHESQAELKSLYNSNTPVVYAYKSIWQVFYSNVQGKYYARIIKRSTTPYTLKGRLHATNDRV